MKNNDKKNKTDQKKTYIKPLLNARGTVFEITKGARGSLTDTARTGSIQIS